jgi:putative ABC transport system permease protein
MRPLPILHRKLLRDAWRLRAQALAIALVMAAGVGMVVMSFGMIRSLEAARADYYARQALADLWLPLRRAPLALMADIRAMPGVATVESRVSTIALLDIAGTAEPVTVRLQSLPVAVNRLVLRTGRLPDPLRPHEVIANAAFAEAARLAPGDSVPALIRGKRVDLQLVGTALSPEYVYVVAPGQVFPDNRRFGVLWMARAPLAAAEDLTGSFNELAIRVAPGAVTGEIVRRLDQRLTGFGGTGAYGREIQMSDRFVTSEIDQLRTMIEILPPVFLGVAVFLLNIMLARLVDAEREIIGLLKAFGYRDGAIMRHYAGLALLLSAGGLLLGFGLGSWLGRLLAALYQAYFAFPALVFRAGADVYLAAAAAMLLAAVAGAAAAVMRARRLTPATAMQPPAPAHYAAGGIGDRIARLAPDEPSRMIVRGLWRRPLRSLATVLGMAAAIGLHIASASATDNVESLLDLAFGRGLRADLTLVFANPRDARARHALAALPGVQRVEPFRTLAVDVRFGPRRSREAIMGVDPDARLSRIISLDGDVVPLAPDGAIMSAQLARKLAVAPGDRIEVIAVEEGRKPFALRVARVVTTPVGGALTMDRAVLNRLVGNGDVANGAHLMVDPRQLDRLFAILKATPLVAGVTVHAATIRGFRDTVAQSMGMITLFNTGFAVLIVTGVAFTSARTSLSERGRDLASMRVLGFRRGEAGYVVLGEQAILGLLAIAPGLGFGLALARYITARFSNDLFAMPATISDATYAGGVLVFAAAALGSAVLTRRRADRLDLVKALKTRE